MQFYIPVAKTTFTNKHSHTLGTRAPKNAGPPVFTSFLAEELGDWVLIESFVHYRKESFYGNLLMRPFN